jgi:hypothetical protein
MAQQTAVEWLEDNLIGNPFSEKDFSHNVNVFKQAKEMEIKQMKESYTLGVKSGWEAYKSKTKK